MTFHYLNYQGVPPTALNPANSFSLTATAPCDVWRKPPNLNVFNAPILYQKLPISTFQRARLTASADWKVLYDQGGIIIVLPPKKSVNASQPPNKRWIKAGIEFYHGKPFMSVVTAEQWADWSLVPLDEKALQKGKVTVEVERDREEDGSLGPVMRILLVGEDGKGVPIREITWGFFGADEEEEMWVGAFAAKPTGEKGDELVVSFEGFEVFTE